MGITFLKLYTKKIDYSFKHIYTYICNLIYSNFVNLILLRMHP